VIVALGVLFVITPFVPKLNREWRPDALMSRAGSVAR
jgi:cytochrome c-type biogenesis protein